MSDQNLHVIVGLGATGVSCARYLQARGIPIAITDSRPNPPHLVALQEFAPNVPLALGGINADLLAKAQKIILSPGVALTEPAIAAQVKLGKPVWGDVELFAQAVTAPIIAITGTNAKSTVTTLVGKMAEAAGYRVQTGGNLGVPVLDLIHPKANLYVLELSSFQLETTFSLKPQVATVLNVTPDHMDRYRDLSHYQQTKCRIYHDALTAVCNHDDLLTECTDITVKQKVYFTLKPPESGEFGLLKLRDDLYLALGNEPLMPVSALPIVGKHYQANALAALAIGHSFGMPFEPMLKVLREFHGLAHRCQLVRERQQVKWFNDSKGTNVGATQAAIEGLGADIEGKLVLIAGGVGKNADFTTLIPTMEKYSRHVVLIGDAAKIIANTIGNRIPYSFANDMQEAVKKAAALALPHDYVLLSPACASFDMYKNFEHRGEVFMEIVRKLD